MKTSWLYAVLFAMGCGGSSVTIDEYAAEQIKIQCEFEVKCCKTVANAVVYTDVSSCETMQTANNASQLAEAKAAVAAGSYKFDASAAAHCSATLKAIASSCSNTLEAKDASACNDVFVGTAAVGAACGSGDIECVPGADCIDGTCKKFLASGATCTSSDNTNYPPCADGLQCDYNASMTCVTPKSDGAACTDSTQCASYDCETTCTARTPTPVTEICETKPQP